MRAADPAAPARRRARCPSRSPWCSASRCSWPARARPAGRHPARPRRPHRRRRAPPLRMVWLGDSTAAGVGASSADGAIPRRVAAASTGPSTSRSLAVSGDRVADVVDDQVDGLAALRPRRRAREHRRQRRRAPHLDGRLPGRLRASSSPPCPTARCSCSSACPTWARRPASRSRCGRSPGWRGRQLDGRQRRRSPTTHGAVYVDIAGETGPDDAGRHRSATSPPTGTTRATTATPSGPTPCSRSSARPRRREEVPMAIDDVAARGFEAGAAAYELARPGYPDEAVAVLVGDARRRPRAPGAATWPPAPASSPAAWSSWAPSVVAVEPVDGMRAAAAAGRARRRGRSTAPPRRSRCPTRRSTWSPWPRRSTGSTRRRRWPRSPGCSGPAGAWRSSGTSGTSRRRGWPR